ncbi:hypothetical protein MA9V2_181 [Chryseobacterium phage MA9V-2]|nr:hypothetical protein MA9V2_181 [Chryseobacterium phage MA9V-2]
MNNSQKPSQTPTGWDMNQASSAMFLNETITCAHEMYDSQLVATGKAKSLNEARNQPRAISCNCNKCSQRGK